jgi:RNA polymerase sigma-70 factor (ECF subfamily)
LNASPEVLLVAAEQRETLLRAVNSLGPADRLVISCRYFLDLSEEETAAFLNCPRGTVKSRLSRALARLKKTLSATAAENVEVEGSIHD